MTLKFSPQRAVIMIRTHAKYQDQILGLVGQFNSGSGNGQTDGRTRPIVDCITFPANSVTNKALGNSRLRPCPAAQFSDAETRVSVA